MGNTRDQVGKAGLFVAGGIFRTAFYVCVAVLISGSASRPISLATMFLTSRQSAREQARK